MSFSSDRSNEKSDADPLSELRSLSKIIDESVKRIEEVYVSRKAPFPSLNEPFNPQLEGPRGDPVVLEAAAHVASAAAQLTAMVMPPAFSALMIALQFHNSSALGVVIDTHVVEILREAGPQGLHINEISKKNKADPNKLARILRLLASEHVFQEITPDVFANNIISSTLDTGKSSSDLIANPAEKHVGTSGIAALLAHTTSHAFKSSAFMRDAILDPTYAFAHQADKSPFNMAYNTNLPLFAWLDDPKNNKDLKVVAMAMEGGKNLAPWDDLEGFDWKGLPQNSIVVDVGGGIGSQSFTLTQRYSHLNIIVQDREPVINDAKDYWKTRMPQAISSGKVKLQVNDFFAGQPIKGAAVYYLRMILHDWSDDYCVTILEQLRKAAAPDSKLLIADNIIDFACRDSDPTFANLPGKSEIFPPSPLLPNNGHGNALRYLTDLQMYVLQNGEERTLHSFSDLLKKSGWKLYSIGKASYLYPGHQHVVAVPA